MCHVRKKCKHPIFSILKNYVANFFLLKNRKETKHRAIEHVDWHEGTENCYLLLFLD